jgi:pimeloyl-ACP methyl ester carboxylesterase
MESDVAAPTQPTRRQRWLRRLYTYGSIYLIAMLASFGCHLADQLILFPTRHSIGLGQAERKLFDVPAGKLEIITARSRAAATTQLKAIAETSLIAHDRLREAAGGRPIFIAGNSLGTTAALHVAANREVAGLMLTNPPPLRQLIRGHHGWWNAWLLAVPVSFGVPSELDSIANARRCRAPAIFVTSSRDEVVPLKYQQRVADAYGGEKRVLSREGANHNDAIEGSDQAWMTQQIEWIWTHAQTPKPAAP